MRRSEFALLDLELMPNEREVTWFKPIARPYANAWVCLSHIGKVQQVYSVYTQYTDFLNAILITSFFLREGIRLNNAAKRPFGHQC